MESVRKERARHRANLLEGGGSSATSLKLAELALRKGAFGGPATGFNAHCRQGAFSGRARAPGGGGGNAPRGKRSRRWTRRGLAACTNAVVDTHARTLYRSWLALPTGNSHTHTRGPDRRAQARARRVHPSNQPNSCLSARTRARASAQQHCTRGGEPLFDRHTLCSARQHMRVGWEGSPWWTIVPLRRDGLRRGRAPRAALFYAGPFRPRSSPSRRLALGLDARAWNVHKKGKRSWLAVSPVAAAAAAAVVFARPRRSYQEPRQGLSLNLNSALEPIMSGSTTHRAHDSKWPFSW